MKVLFIGGTGIISSACTELAVERGIELFLFNRGQSSRPVPQDAQVVRGDIDDIEGTRRALDGHTFDVVVDWIVFNEDQVERDLALFGDRTGQYIFISSASAYQKPVTHLPITESTPLHNPFWAYSRAKAACERRLMAAYREQGFPVTIVRPSHTYDQTLLPMRGRYTEVARMRQGKPVVVQGDGTSLWVMTHHRDFARGFVGLLGLPKAVGETFHITSDEVLTWDQIYRLVARAAGAPEPELVHVPSELIAAYDPDWGASLLGDKAHSVIFDNSKIKRFVPEFAATIPFARGAEEIMAWYDDDPGRQRIDPAFDAQLERMIAAVQGARP